MFKKVYEDFSRSRRLPRMRTVSRTGPAGEEEFYAFELEQDYYPNRPGKIDGGNVQIIANYPLSLKRTRGSKFMDNEFDDLLRDFDDLFPGRTRLKIDDTRPQVAQAELGTTEVLPIPVSGRPATYRGADGRYRMTAESKTRRVIAGESDHTLAGRNGKRSHGSPPGTSAGRDRGVNQRFQSDRSSPGRIRRKRDQVFQNGNPT